MGSSQDQNTPKGNQTQISRESVDQAKRDYAVFLAKMKELGEQYGQVTGEVKKVVKEQGVPVWDDASGTFKISHDVNFSSTGSGGSFQETEKELKLIIEKPGLKKNSIRITIENDKTMRLKAFKKSKTAGQPDEPVDETYELPTLVSDPKPVAKYEDGVLTVTIQKSNLPKKTVQVPVQ